MKYGRLIGIGICSFLLMVSLFGCKAKVTPEKALSLLPRESSFVIVVDMNKVAATEFYNKVKEDEDRLKEYNKLIEKTGIDPQKDVDKIAISVSENVKENNEIAALAFGRFEKDKILSTIEENVEIITEKYQDQEIYLLKEKEIEKEEEGEEEEEEEEEEGETKRKHNHGEFRLAFLEEGLIAAGGPQYIKKVIDLYQGKGESIEANQDLMAVIKEANQKDMVWGAGIIPSKLKTQAEENPMSKAFAAISSVVFSVNLDKDLDAFFKMKCDEKENVKNLTDAINGFIALGRMGAAEKPEVNEMLDGITVEGLDDMVSVSMHISEDLMTRLSEQAAKKECAEEAEKEPEEPKEPEKE